VIPDDERVPTVELLGVALATGLAALLGFALVYRRWAR
jgi:hypothetical protein